MPLGPCSLCPDSDSMSISVDLQIERDLADRLDRVGMEQRAGVMRHCSQLLDRKQRSGLVVRPHHRGDRRARPQCAPIGFNIEPALRIDPDEMDFDPARRREMFQQREDGGMLDRRRDDLVATVLRIERRENGACCRIRCRRR